MADGSRVLGIVHLKDIVKVGMKERIAQHTEGRTLGLLGEPRVSVLQLNLALDERFPRKQP